MNVLPTLRPGKWAVGLTAGVLVLLLVFFVGMAAGLVDFNTGHWWDATVGIAVPVELAAFIVSIFAIRKEKSILTYCALVLGALVILFILTHSLFISD